MIYAEFVTASILHASEPRLFKSNISHIPHLLFMNAFQASISLGDRL